MRRYLTNKGAAVTTLLVAAALTFVPPPGGVAAGDGSLIFSTFFGGTQSDMGYAMAVDSDGNAYIAGPTNSPEPEFPVTPGAFDTTYNGGSVGDRVPEVGDAFVAKLDNRGQLVWSTFLGGSRDDVAQAVAVDAQGNVYVVGQTASADFPTTPNAFDRSPNGGPDGFVAKLDPSGSRLLYSTYLGGTGTSPPPLGDLVRSIAVDGRGGAYVTGPTDSPDFPVTSNAFDPSHNGVSGQEGSEAFHDAFVAKVNTEKVGARSLEYSTFLGGSNWDIGHGIAVEGGNAYVTGRVRSPDFPTTEGVFSPSYNGGFEDGFVAKIDPSRRSANSLVYSTFIGGSEFDLGVDIAVDASGNAHVTGLTCSADFPTTPGAFDEEGSHSLGVGCSGLGYDAYVLKLDPKGSTLLHATYVGGSSFEIPFGIKVHASGRIYVAGTTRSPNFPITADAFDPTFNGTGGRVGCCDAFAVVLDASGSTLDYSTFLGGSQGDDASMVGVNPEGDAYIVGTTTSPDFPTTGDAFDPSHNGGFDIFVSKITP